MIIWYKLTEMVREVWNMVQEVWNFASQANLTGLALITLVVTLAVIGKILHNTGYPDNSR